MSALAAAAPLMPALVGCRCDREIILNVALHGLFVMNFTDSYIELLTPEIDSHIYKVGGWDVDQISPIDPGSRYTLKGVKDEATVPFFDWNQTPTYFQSIDRVLINYGKSHCQVNLPFPNALKLLRCARAGEYPAETYSPATGCDAGTVNKDITSVSLCQVLTYKVPDYRNLELVGSSWIPHIDRETHTANLHLWAEPPKRLTARHAEEAYSQLSCLLPPLNLHLRVYSTVPIDRDTGIVDFPGTGAGMVGLGQWRRRRSSSNKLLRGHYQEVNAKILVDQHPHLKWEMR